MTVISEIFGKPDRLVFGLALMVYVAHENNLLHGQCRLHRLTEANPGVGDSLCHCAVI